MKNSNIKPGRKTTPFQLHKIGVVLNMYILLRAQNN